MTWLAVINFANLPYTAALYENAASIYHYALYLLNNAGTDRIAPIKWTFTAKVIQKFQLWASMTKMAACSSHFGWLRPRILVAIIVSL